MVRNTEPEAKISHEEEMMSTQYSYVAWASKDYLGVESGKKEERKMVSEVWLVSEEDSYPTFWHWGIMGTWKAAGESVASGQSLVSL